MTSDHSHKMAEIGPTFFDYSQESVVNYHRMKNLLQNTFQCFPPQLLSLHSGICKKMGLIALQLLPYHSLIVHPLPRNSSTIASLASSSVFFCSSSLTLTSRLAFSSIICLSFAFSASTSATFLLSSGISAFSPSISANFFLSSAISSKSLAFNSLNESID